MKIKEINLPGSPEHMGLEPGARAFVMGPCRVIVGQSERGWHLSISHPERYPMWDEVKMARYQLIPDDVTMGLLLPPEHEYVNIHPTTFHLWQIPNDTGKPKTFEKKLLSGLTSGWSLV